MKKVAWQSRTKQDLVIEVWDHLGNPPVGEAVLQQVMRVLRDRFSDGAVDSPAAIARTLIDAGAELRHPEVLEFDARWREHASRQRAAKTPAPLFDLENEWSLQTGAAWIGELGKLRLDAAQGNDRKAVKRLEDLARETRQHALTLAASRALSPRKIAAAAEIAEWLTIWLQTPQLFQTWLDLRQQSAEFRAKFGNEIFATSRGPTSETLK
ncbi:MAG: hypothetical protein QOE77_427 [Blastocatellia bacterium]|jgi:hypothetical protein|nr:hypothetical protein [Blastocatellia bacterium]